MEIASRPAAALRQSSKINQPRQVSTWVSLRLSKPQYAIARRAAAIRQAPIEPRSAYTRATPKARSARRAKHRAEDLCSSRQAVRTSILRGRTAARLGIRILRTPSLMLASMPSVSSSPLKAKLRR